MRLQKEIAKRVVAKDNFGGIRRVCGVDVAYDGFVEVGSEILGYDIGNTMYVGVGHMISLETAIAIVKEIGTKPLRFADINSKMQKRRKGLSS